MSHSQKLKKHNSLALKAAVAELAAKKNPKLQRSSKSYFCGHCNASKTLASKYTRDMKSSIGGLIGPGLVHLMAGVYQAKVCQVGLYS